MITLEGKVAVVTGGSRGIGAATSVLLAKAGADVAINYVENGRKADEVVACIANTGRRTIRHKGDVGQRSVAREFIDKVMAELGNIDIVVNNAGIWTHLEVGDGGEGVWDETLQTNLKSVFNICNEAVPHMKRRGGKIINIASTAGQRGEAFHSHYAASKGGILAFTKSLALELAPHKILVNAVAPGWVDTEMNDEVFSDSDFFSRVIETIPLKKVASAKDVAGAVLFLASSLADHITGATINVNGGSVLY